MTPNCYQKHTEDTKIILKRKNTKDEKRFEKNIKILLKKKNKIGVIILFLRNKRRN